MAEAVLGPLVGRLQELVMSEARAMVAVNEDVRSLRDKLMWMQAFLRDAEPRRRANNDELIRVCLQQTRDVVFDTEDAVDQYFFRIDLSSAAPQTMLPKEKRHRGTAIVRSRRPDHRVSPKQCPPPTTVKDPHSAHHHSALKATPTGRLRRQGRRHRPLELGFSLERQVGEK
uniref:Disease resistance N-terminal domain-containing protein n=1 Tax=Aegilops tauschii TaxID=37682 RepID=M8AYJ5_AEGTA